MSKRRLILVAALVPAVLGGLMWILVYVHNSEPVYEGKRLSAWVMGKEPRAEEAIRRIGTNSIPTLLRMLSARDSALKLKLLALANKQRLIKIHVVSAAEQNMNAALAFHALRNDAKGAVPALMKIYGKQYSPESQFSVVVALGYIGPDAKSAFPLLVRAKFDNEHSTNQSRLAISRHAEQALSEILMPTTDCASLMTDTLSDPDPRMRRFAASTLLEFGARSKPAIPKLIELLKDPDSATRKEAAMATRRIDPDVTGPRKAELDAAMAPLQH